MKIRLNIKYENKTFYETLILNTQKSVRTFKRNQTKGIIITMYTAITRYKYQ